MPMVFVPAFAHPDRAVEHEKANTRIRQYLQAPGRFLNVVGTGAASEKGGLVILPNDCRPGYDIHFADAASIWRTDPLHFRLGLLPAGFYFKSPVTISLVDKGVSHEV